MLFLALALSAYMIQNFSNKTFSIKHGSRLATLQNEICVIGAMLVLLVCGYARLLPRLGMAMSVAYGIFYFLTIYFLLRAMAQGSLGICTIVCNMGNFIPVLFGVFVFHDEINVFTVIGIAFMIATLILSMPSSPKKTGTGYKWFIMALCSALCNGVLGIMKTYVAKELPGVSNGSFLFWSFLFASLTGALIIGSEVKRGLPVSVCFEKFGSKALLGLGAGFGTALANLFFMMALASGISSAILFPLNTSLLSVLLWLMSWLVFHDVKPNLKNVFALISCVIGVILINIK